MKIAVLVSGGVDSAVSLALLKKHGYDVTAFYLKIWLEDELSYLGSCPWQEDLNYVEKICEQLQVSLNIVSLQKEYHERVVSYTVSQAKAGLTPNPDIMCNQQIKFGMFLDYLGSSFDKVATGHYAQVKEDNGIFRLYQAPDSIKDQTYFLSHLSQKQLSRAMFPIGHLAKAEVRSLAQQFELCNKDRKDSQGICFLGKLKFSDFLRHYLGEMPGEIIESESGIVIGTHKGYWFYTIGQRQGLGLAGGPWYVVAKDMHSNTIVVSKDYYSLDKKRNMFTIADENWFAGERPLLEKLKVKLRHGPQFHECVLQSKEDGSLVVHLQKDDQGIAAGQFAVFYKDEQCLGSGVIQYI